MRCWELPPLTLCPSVPAHSFESIRKQRELRCRDEYGQSHGVEGRRIAVRDIVQPIAATVRDKSRAVRGIRERAADRRCTEDRHRRIQCQRRGAAEVASGCVGFRAYCEITNFS